MPQHVKKRRSRSDWHVIFQSDRERGYTGTQIARRHGVGHTFVYSVLNDPTGAGERERRLRYRGTCEDCGAPTDGSNGKARAPTRCHRCTMVLVNALRRGTGRQLLNAFDAFPPGAEFRYRELRARLALTAGATSMLLYGKPYGLIAQGFVERKHRGVYRMVA
jgi:hypothetical protein